jgi:HK97 family phage major capsid protein
MRKLSDLANDDAHKWTEEDEAHWQQANEDYNALTRKIEMEERAAQVERELSAAKPQAQEMVREINAQGANIAKRHVLASQGKTLEQMREERVTGGVTTEDRCLALQGWMLAQAGIELSEEHRNACRKTRTNPNQRELEVQLRRDPYNRIRAEFRADVNMTLSATEGGDTVPEGFVNNFERALLAFGGVRQVADVIRTATGADLPWPTANDTGNVGALLGEETTIGESLGVTTATTTFNAYKYSSRLVKISTELLQDSAFDLASLLAQMLAERIARITNTHFTTGNGSSKPLGIVNASAEGPTTASATAVTADELVDLEHSVDPAYRNGPNSGFMLNDNTLAAVRKLKGSDNNYLWNPGLQLGTPQRLLSYPVTINQDMVDIASTTKSVLFGALGKYKVRDVASIRIRRLVERYADVDQEGFIAFSRHDGALLDAGTNPVKHLLQKT